MIPNHNSNSINFSLRETAEKLLSNRLPLIEEAIEYSNLELLHELRLHQIELEIQNESLRQMQIKLEESRDHYFDLYEFAPVGYITLNEDGIITAINLAAVKLLSDARLLRKERTALLGRIFFTFIAVKDRDKWGHYFLATKKYEKIGNIELEMLCGSEVLVDYAKSASSIQLTLTNITEYKKTKQEQEKLETLLLQSQKIESIGQLASGVAHDFNNILMPIIGFSRMGLKFIQDNNVEKVLECFERIEKSGLRAKDLVNKILIFCRDKDYSEVEESLPFFKVLEEIESTKQMLRASISSAIQIELQNSISEDSFSVLIHLTDLHQIITNLVINARDAIQDFWANSQEIWMCDGGKITISLSLKKYSNAECNICINEVNDEYFVVSVQDTGLGIEKEQLNRIFDPFFTTKDVGKGTGLGLSIVSGIIKSLNGHIIVQSKRNEGTKISLLIPMIKNENLVSISNETGIQQPIFSLKNNLKILVVDDEEEICALFKEKFSYLGYVVETFTDSIEALLYFSSSPNDFDVVMTNYGMANMTGLDLSMAILAIRPEIPILICTGYSDRLKSNDDLPKGNTFLFKKPVDFDVLHETIAKFNLQHKFL